MASDTAIAPRGRAMARPAVVAGICAGMSVGLLLPATQAQAADDWNYTDVTRIAGAPPAAASAFPFTTNLDGEVGRVVYVASGSGRITELSTRGRGWEDTDLNARTRAPLPADEVVVGYSTRIAGQGALGRVIYRDGRGHVWELSVNRSGWTSTDLTDEADVPRGVDAADVPYGFTSDDGRGQVAHVVYRTTRGKVVELRYSAATRRWQYTDLSARTGAPPAAAGPTGYSADLGDGPTVRVVYRTTRDHVQELSSDRAGRWVTTDLTGVTRGSRATGVPAGIVTTTNGRDVARVVYPAAGGHVEEISSAGRGGWRALDVTAYTRTPQVADVVAFPYTVDDGARGRVAYRTPAGHVWQLTVGPRGWSGNDLTDRPGPNDAPDATDFPAGFSTDFPGQDTVERVYYRAPRGQIIELSSAG